MEVTSKVKRKLLHSCCENESRATKQNKFGKYISEKLSLLSRHLWNIIQQDKILQYLERGYKERNF